VEQPLKDFQLILPLLAKTLNLRIERFSANFQEENDLLKVGQN
jgi:hypothetical protein